MKNRKIPMRTCVITKEKCEKRDLLRIVRTPENEIVIDPTGKQNGRGAYIKKTEEVALKAKKSNALSRHLETEISDEFYEELIKFVRGN